MKPSSLFIPLRRLSVLLPVLAVIVGLGALPLACSDESCTTGTVGVDFTVPAAAVANAVDVTVEQDRRVLHRERLTLPMGSKRVTAAIKLPEGYPEGKYVTVSAVAKRIEGTAEAVVGTWYTAETFPKGCVAFVATLYPTSTTDGGDADGGGFVFDGAVVDAVSAPDADVTSDAAGDVVDAGSDGRADAAGDAAVDASPI